MGYSDQMSSSSLEDVREVQAKCCEIRCYLMGTGIEARVCRKWVQSAAPGFLMLCLLHIHQQQSQRKGKESREKDRGVLSGHFKHFAVKQTHTDSGAITPAGAKDTFTFRC